MTSDSRDPPELAAPGTAPPGSHTARAGRQPRASRGTTASTRPTKKSPPRDIDEPAQSEEMEFDIELARRQAAVDPPPNLAPETPMPRCLTQGNSRLGRHPSIPSNIPRAPRLPNLTLTDDNRGTQKRAQPSRRERPSSLPPVLAHEPATVNRSEPLDFPPTEDELPPSAESTLGLPTDRVLPGSPALVSTFRPKPELRSCYSVTRSCQEERVFTPKRAVPAKRRQRKPTR